MTTESDHESRPDEIDRLAGVVDNVVALGADLERLLDERAWRLQRWQRLSDEVAEINARLDRAAGITRHPSNRTAVVLPFQRRDER